MTNQEASKIIKDGIEDMSLDFADEEQYEALTMAIKALEQEPTDRIEYGTNENAYKLWISNGKEYEPSGDLISREPFTDSTICEGFSCDECSFNRKDKGGCILEERVMNLPSVEQEPKTGHCKDCKYFEYDSVASVDGIPLIVAHEICSRWGDGCKTKEGGYCFLFEPQERSDKE